MPDETVQAGTTNEPPVPASVLTIFGASGDLTQRLLLPSIYNLIAAKILPDNFRLLGVAVEDWDDAKFQDHIATTLKQFWGQDADANNVAWLSSRARYQQANFDDAPSFEKVKRAIEGIESSAQTCGNRLFYLAVAPSFIATVSCQLARVGLLKEEDGGPWRRLIIEKPFGHDLASAVKLNAELQTSLCEHQIYRIDHFAGKETVQDLSVVRFSNAIFEPLWNRSMIDNVQITAAETVGVERRAGYYEKSGATRDMVPNHMAELLSLVAMEPPVAFSAEYMRDKQVEVLQSIRQIKPEQVPENAVRGQYGPGFCDGQDRVGYQQEPGVNPDSATETYIALKVEIDNWRWSGVPFYIRTGKRLACASTEIVITFRKPPARLFPNRLESDRSPNQLVFNLQPKQSIQLTFGGKAPGLKTVVERNRMAFQFNESTFGNHGKGYERLLRDAMLGDTTLFQRAEFVEQGWRMVEPLLEAWSQPPAQGEFPNYAAGSTGPEAAKQLLAKDGRAWVSLEQE
jgi:glucose-6-phosphate 1-dehydrogenase